MDEEFIHEHQPPPGLARRIAAWAVHAFTASGAVAGFLAWAAITRHEFQAAFAWMAVAVIIDSADGALARWCRVKQVLPHFDGALLDNIVDYFTYAAVPAAFFYEADGLPEGTALPATAAVLMASAYQFCQANAKTSDYFFVGFPSYWNIVALYQFLLTPQMPWLNLVMIAACAALTFVPIKYVYPSRTPVARKLTLVLGVVWAALLLAALALHPDGHFWPALASLAYVAYYVVLSGVLHARSLRQA